MLCRDRVQSDHIPITHEFLAMMLGTRRTSVTVAAGIANCWLIAYSNGHVTIQDLGGLRGAACECYQIIHDEYARLGLL
jgi:hypothetical protein